MSVEYAELDRLSPQSFAEASTAMSKAATTLATEYRQYDSGVLGPLQAKHGWRGGGQPDAAVVAEVNGLAIDTMRLRAETGSLAYLYGHLAFTVAKQRLTELRDRLRGERMRINGFGTVVDESGHDFAKKDAFQAELDAILKSATKADTRTAKMLDANREPPVVSLSNYPGLLQKARNAHKDAATDHSRATRQVRERLTALEAVTPEGRTEERIERLLDSHRLDLTPDEILAAYRVEDGKVVQSEVISWFDTAGRITEGEARLLATLLPVQLAAFAGIRKSAKTETRARFADADNPAGRGNAFQHAFWSAYLTSQYGEDFARRYATAHERLPGNPQDQETMDLYNNELGRRIAVENPDASPAELADLVEKAVRDGRAVQTDGEGGVKHTKP